MFNIEIAGLVITVDNRYQYIEERCRDYITEKENTTGIILSATDDMMNNSIEYKRKFDHEEISPEEAEFDCIHYPLYKQLHRFDAFWLHSVLVDKGGDGYAFTASPGGGKSTHAKLWLEVFDDARIVNGDNTIVRKDSTDGNFYGYGTPFCGKEALHENRRVPIKAVCFIKKSEQNFVKKIVRVDAVLRMLMDNWCIDKADSGILMDLYTQMDRQVDYYSIHCNMEPEAAVTAYKGING